MPVLPEGISDRDAVYQAIGYASVCWDETPTGIFESTKARDVADELMDKVVLKPRLGLATTFELVAELAARTSVSQSLGEEWPNYKTVAGV